MLIQHIHHVAYRCKDAYQTVKWYEQHLGMNFVLAIAEDQVPSTHAPDPYMHIFMDAGGGNVLATLCDLTIASENAQFGQVGPKMGSVDPGFGTAYLSRIVGEKKAREIWFLCRQYDAATALTSPRGHSANAFMNLIRGVQDLLGLFVFGGVFERHPDLQMVVAEGDAGWVGNKGWLGRLEAHDLDVFRRTYDPATSKIWRKRPHEHRDFLDCFRNGQPPMYTAVRMVKM